MDHVVENLERYQRVLEPATDEWPVVPTRYRLSIATAVREELCEQGWSKGAVKTALDEATGMEYSVSTRSHRRRYRRRVPSR